MLPPSISARAVQASLWILGGLCLVTPAGCGSEPAPGTNQGEPGGATNELPRAAEGGPQQLVGDPCRPFETRFELPIPGYKPMGALLVDTDGDGEVELIEVTKTPGALFIWSGLKQGFRTDLPPRRLELGAYGIGPVAVDPARPQLIAAASADTRSLHVFDVSQDPGKEERLRLDLDSPPTALAAGKLRGAQGVVIAVITDKEELHLVDSKGKRTLLPLAGRDGDTATSLHFLADGSGLLVGLQGKRRVDVYVPDAQGKLMATPAHSVTLSGMPRDFLESDLDGDGDSELIVAGGDHSLWIFGWKQAGGALAALANQDVQPLDWRVGAIPIDVDAADVDGDGVQELCVLNFYDYNILILDDWASGTPRKRTLLSCGQTPWSLAIGDLNGDGHVDLVTTNRDALCSSILVGSGDGRFLEAHNTPCGRAPRSVAACDLNGDGYPEVLAISAIDQGIVVLENHAGRLRTGAKLNAPPATDAMLGADLDGDGHGDIAYLANTSHGAQLVILFGDGTGALALREQLAPYVYGKGVGDLWAGDLNGNGLPDLVISDTEGGRIVLLQAQQTQDIFSYGHATFFDVAGGPGAIALLPAGNGHPPRLCIGLEGPGQSHGVVFIEVLQSAGVATLKKAGGIPVKRRATDVACADFDGDGLIDLAILGSGTSDVNAGEIFVYLAHRGGAPAWIPVPPLLTSHAPYGIEAADLDGDGRADLVSTSQHSHHLSAWLSKATEQGTRFLRLVDLGVGRGPLDLCLSDIDRDGHLDVVVGDHYSAEVSVLFNRLPRPAGR